MAFDSHFEEIELESLILSLAYLGFAFSCSYLKNLFPSWLKVKICAESIWLCSLLSIINLCWCRHKKIFRNENIFFSLNLKWKWFFFVINFRYFHHLSFASQYKNALFLSRRTTLIRPTARGAWSNLIILVEVVRGKNYKLVSSKLYCPVSILNFYFIPNHSLWKLIDWWFLDVEIFWEVDLDSLMLKWFIQTLWLEEFLLHYFLLSLNLRIESLWIGVSLFFGKILDRLTIWISITQIFQTRHTKILILFKFGEDNNPWRTRRYTSVSWNIVWEALL